MRNESVGSKQPGQQASSRVGLLLLILILGFATGALVIYEVTKPKPPKLINEENITLSESAKSVLNGLRAPVEIRFYALFSPGTGSGNLRDFGAQLGELLSAFKTVAGEKLNITRFTEWSDASTKAAAADGIVPFNLEKGEPAYIGLTVNQDGRKETFTRLSSEWAGAVEFDLARAIARVSTPPTTSQPAANLTEATNAEAAVKRVIPNPTTTSAEDGQQILRDASLKEFQAVVTEMNAEVEKAEQRIRKADAEKDEDVRQSARQQLQEVRAKYTEKLRDIGLRSQAEIEAWQKMKAR